MKLRWDDSLSDVPSCSATARPHLQRLERYRPRDVRVYGSPLHCCVIFSFLCVSWYYSGLCIRACLGMFYGVFLLSDHLKKVFTNRGEIVCRWILDMCASDGWRERVEMSYCVMWLSDALIGPLGVVAEGKHNVLILHGYTTLHCIFFWENPPINDTTVLMRKTGMRVYDKKTIYSPFKKERLF